MKKSIPNQAAIDSINYPAEFPGPKVKLHIYLASGEFLCEHDQWIESNINQFSAYLEAGFIAPELDLEWPLNNGGPSYVYYIVWNGMFLEDEMRFTDLIRDHGMSETEPNDITVIKHEYGSEKDAP